MDPTASLHRDIRELLIATFPNRAEEIAALTPRDSLIERRLLDSLSFLELVELLERKHGVTVAAHDFLPDLFGTLEDVAAYVARQVG